MKRNLNFVLLVTLMLSLISSCTVEKRRYMSGYHIEKNNNVKTAQKSTKEIKNEKNEEIVKVEENSNISKEEDGTLIYNDNLSASTAININEVVTNSNVAKKVTKKSRIVKEIAAVKSVFLNAANAPAPPANGQKVHWAAIVSLSTGIVGVLLLNILLGACGIVFGAIALKKISDDNGTYKGKGMAIAGLVCGIVASVGFLIVIASL